METFFFAVPHRLLWDNWERFCGAQDDPGDSIDFSIPRLNAGGHGVGSMADYFGIPITVSLQPNALAFRHLAHRAQATSGSEMPDATD